MITWVWCSKMWARLYLSTTSRITTKTGAFTLFSTLSPTCTTMNIVRPSPTTVICFHHFRSVLCQRYPRSIVYVLPFRHRHEAWKSECDRMGPRKNFGRSVLIFEEADHDWWSDWMGPCRFARTWYQFPVQYRVLRPQTDPILNLNLHPAT